MSSKPEQLAASGRQLTGMGGPQGSALGGGSMALEQQLASASMAPNNRLMNSNMSPLGPQGSGGSSGGGMGLGLSSLSQQQQQQQQQQHVRIGVSCVSGVGFQKRCGMLACLLLPTRKTRWD